MEFSFLDHFAFFSPNCQMKGQDCLLCGVKVFLFSDLFQFVFPNFFVGPWSQEKRCRRTWGCRRSLCKRHKSQTWNFEGSIVCCNNWLERSWCFLPKISLIRFQNNICNWKFSYMTITQLHIPRLVAKLVSGTDDFWHRNINLKTYNLQFLTPLWQTLLRDVKMTEGSSFISGLHIHNVKTVKMYNT